VRAIRTANDGCRKFGARSDLGRLMLLLSAAFLFFGIGTALAGGSARAPSFAAAKYYAVGRSPLAVAVADVNGDRRPDVLAANAPGSISVLLNRGHGRLAPQQSFKVGVDPPAIAVADFNVDHRPDVATAAFDVDKVSVLLNQGGGRFGSRHDYSVGSQPEWVAAGDLNGDGTQDLVTANSGEDGTISVLLGKGDGTFETQQVYAVGQEPATVAIGDLNDDGKPDLAVADENGSAVTLLFNAGDGTFGGRQDVPVGDGPHAIALVDLNGDGKKDIVTTNSYGGYSVLLRSGDGFLAARVHSLGGHAAAFSLTVADFTGDGKPDLAIGYFDFPGVLVLPGRGNGSFAPWLLYRTGINPFGIASGDLDGDGRPELVSTVLRSKVSVLVNRPGRRCEVPYLVYSRLRAARAQLALAACRLGRVSRARADVPAGEIASQKPVFGAVLPVGARVNVVVSKGPRR
jgi:hypothetical protein